jgi:hypothetical protein
MRQFAGFGAPEDTNQRFKFLLPDKRGLGSWLVPLIAVSSQRSALSLPTRPVSPRSAMVFSVRSRTLRPSTSLRYAQGERGGGESIEKFPFVLSPSASLRTGFAA